MTPHADTPAEEHRGRYLWAEIDRLREENTRLRDLLWPRLS
jgi:hypothetical protein